MNGRDERRLTAILAADVVGYSKLIEADDSRTRTELRTVRAEVIDPLIDEHAGRIVSTAGDSILAEFNSAVDAVQCAVEIQRAMAVRNEPVSDDKRIQFRIGVNVGDIIVEGDDIHGDGVNVAARLEGLADPGGVFISGDAFRQVRNKPELGFEDLGEQTVKNITEPVRVYRVLLAPEAAGTLIAAKVPRRTPTPWVVAVAAVLIVVIGGGVIWNFAIRDNPIRVEAASLERMAFPLPAEPSIAVLPFDNMTGDPDQEILVDGLVEDIITSLSQVPRLFVVARNSTFTYKGQAVKVGRVAEEMGVRYVLEGSVRIEDGEARITAQLIDAIQGQHIWAERYERDLGSVFALQDDITTKITAAIDVELVGGEGARFLHSSTSNTKARTLLLRAREAGRQLTPQGNLAARQLLEEAIKLDPDYSAALVALSGTYTTTAQFGWESFIPAMQKASELAKKALALNSTSAAVFAQLGQIQYVQRNFDASNAQFEKALALEPNNAASTFQAARNNVYAGRSEVAIPQAKRAMRLNPAYPVWFLTVLDEAYVATGRYENAIEVGLEFEDRLDANEHFGADAALRLAIAYSLAGEQKNAEKWAQEAIRRNPRMTVAGWSRVWPYRHSNPDLFKRKFDAAIAAGIPVTIPSTKAESYYEETSNVAASEAFQKGWVRYHRGTPEALGEAVSLFKKAIEIDPAYGRPYAAVALTYLKALIRGWHESVGIAPFPRGESEIAEAILRAQRRPTALYHTARSTFDRQVGPYHDGAVVEAEMAIARDPNEAEAYGSLGQALVFSGRAPEAVSPLEEAIRRAPMDGSYVSALGRAYFAMGQFEKTIELMESAQQLAISPTDVLYVAAAYAHLGRQAAAEEAYRRAEEVIQGRISLCAPFLRFGPLWKERIDVDRFIDGLAKAGLPKSCG